MNLQASQTSDVDFLQQHLTANSKCSVENKRFTYLLLVYLVEVEAGQEVGDIGSVMVCFGSRWNPCCTKNKSQRRAGESEKVALLYTESFN